MVKICLNMIVKNESKIITRLLESVVGFIDSYCICDTGSTDNTEEVITQFFSKRGITGKIIHEPFRDFGYNRTFALKACEGLPNADYILLLDADMQLQINPKLTPEIIRSQLRDELYFIFQGNEFLYYKNVRIVKNNVGLTYWGVTHEYVKLPEDANNFKYNQFDKSVIFINDVGDGGSKTNKYTRDIELLEKGLEEIPNNDRYLFYLANSYRDIGQFQLAIETYKKRIAVGGWFEEIWQSHYSIGKCAKIIGNMELAIYHWLEAYQIFPQRLENIYEIIHHYRNIMKNELAYQFYTIADEERKRFTGILDFLFLQKDVYDWKIDYEMTIIAFYRNSLPYNICEICMKVLCYPFLEDGYALNIFSNYKFYSKKMVDFASKDDHTQKWNTLKRSTISNQCITDDFISSTPSFCMTSNGELVSLIRYVNYRILEDGSYQNKEHIETRNILSKIDIKKHPTGKWIKNREILLRHDVSRDNVYVGLEDVRLFLCKNGKICYTANRGLNHNHIVVEFGTIDVYNGKTLNSLLLKGGKGDIEKNWVLFEDFVGPKASTESPCLKIVHSWYPLTIGVCLEDVPEEGNFVVTNQIPSPRFFHYLRGSTNGITIGDEIWFVCHSVSYEARRYYYHLFVVLDVHTFKPKKYSPFFTFEGQIVEYCLGLLHFSERDEFMLGYSLLDRETKYMMVPKKNILDFMIAV
jgi:tetratricopeptide (TPR) repeat protein